MPTSTVAHDKCRFIMTRVRVEVEGRTDEVVRILWHLGGKARDATSGLAVEAIGTPATGGDDPLLVTGPGGAGESRGTVPEHWTETLAGDFLGALEPTARRVVLHVWRAGAAGIHKSALCQGTGLTPAELRSLLIQMSYQVRRFQQERGRTLSRPVVPNRQRQSYLVNPEFAAIAELPMFAEMMPRQLANGAGRP